jgi:hypothetical protein
MPTTRPRSSLRLKKPTPKAAALNTPPKAKAPSPTITPSKRQPNSHAASATPNKKPRRGLQHFQLKRKSDKKKPRVARELLEPELEPEPEPELEPEDEKASESESSGDEQEETDDEDDKKADDGQPTDGDNADETDPEAADESEDSDDDEESDESVIEVVNKVQPKSKAQKYAQRPEREQREQTFLEFMATLSEDESDESDDTDDTDAELAEQVEPPEVDAEQGPTIISLSIDVYTSRVTGLANSTVVIDQKRSDANQRFIIDARNIIGVTKWNRGSMSYDTIHYLKVNDLLVGVELRDKNTRISYEAYGVPQRRLVTEFDNDMAKLLKELNKRFSEFGYQFESNSDAPLLLFNFIKGDDNSNYLHGHTFFLGESILNELGSSVTHNGKRMYRLHPKTKLKDAARKLDQYIRNNGIRATEIKVKNQTFHPIF